MNDTPFLEGSSTQNKTAHTVLYEKQVGEESYYVVQAVPVAKAKTLYIVTAFRGKQGYKAQKKEASQLNNAKSPAATSKNATVITSNNSKSQKAEAVKKQYSIKYDTSNMDDESIATAKSVVGDLVERYTILGGSFNKKVL